MTSLEQHLSALAGAAAALAGELDLDEVLDTLVRSAAEVTGARYAALGVLDDQQRIARFVTHGADDETVERIGHYPTGKGLLGLLIRKPETLRLANMADHPASSGFPAGHPPMTSFLGTPVRLRGQVFGNFYLTDKDGGFEPVDEHLLEVLAAQAGAAIETAQLSARLRDLAIADERERISRELHDGVIQWLFSIGMGLESARALLPDGTANVDQRLEGAVDGLDRAIRELRAAIFRLRPQHAATLGLVAGLTELAREYEVNALMRPSLQVARSLDAHVPAGVVPDALQIVREALSNVARHARATSVSVSAALDDGWLQIAVSDDGEGFEVHGDAPVGHGLANMRERATALGAQLEVEAKLGAGATVRLWVPVAATASEEG